MFDSDATNLCQADDVVVAALAKALAHPARIRIIAVLLAQPGCIGGEIVDQLGLAQSTVSEHLRILRDAGIVTGTIDHPRICYALDPAALAPLGALVRAVAARSPTADAACRPANDRGTESGLGHDA